jgi:hypothetical protein
MSHYARVIDGVVIEVLVAEQDFIDVYSTQVEGEFIQTSYNTQRGVHIDPETGEPSADQTRALRKNYASVGGEYNADLDMFIPPKEYPSWTVLDETIGEYVAPVAKPDDGNTYEWDESQTNWVIVEA